MSARCWFNTGPVELEVVIWSNTFIYAAILRIINKLMMGVGKITLSKRKECQLRNSKINIQCQLSAIQVKSILEQSLYHFDWSLSWWFMYMSRAKRQQRKMPLFSKYSWLPISRILSISNFLVSRKNKARQTTTRYLESRTFVISNWF